MTDISRLTLERWALDDLPADELASLQASLDAEPELLARAERVRDEITAAADLPALPTFSAGPVPASAFTEDVLEAKVVRPVWRRPAPWIGAIAALLLFALFQQPEAPTERFRGALDVQVHLVRNGVAVEQGLLLQASAGERLQYRVIAPARGHISVFDLQDNGELSEWTKPTPVQAMQPLEGAVLLDDYAGSERIYFVFDEDPVPLEAARTALGTAFQTPLAELEKLPGLDATQRSVLLVKR
jgi:hypothetical protein